MYVPQRTPTTLGQLYRKQPGCQRVVGLDLGTSCGVALADFVPGQNTPFQLFVDLLDLSRGDYDSGVVRFVRLMQFLEELQPDLIGFEEVKFTPPGDMLAQRGLSISAVCARIAKPAEFLGALKTVAATWGEMHNVPVVGYSIQSLKQFATGKGNASKSDMVAAANQHFGFQFDPATAEQTHCDDMVDAAFALVKVYEDYPNGVPRKVVNGQETTCSSTGGVVPADGDCAGGVRSGVADTPAGVAPGCC